VDTRSQRFRVIGRRTPKVDAIDKVTGRAQFGADVPLSRLLMGKVLRSPHAHAHIRRIDTEKAAALPGVHAIITSHDLPTITPGTRGKQGSATLQESYLSQEVLARDRVLFHGHAVAAVAATSSDIAEAALELIQVEYEPLPYVLDPVASMQPEAVRLHDDLYTQTATGKATIPSNIAEHLEMGRGNVAQGFAEEVGETLHRDPVAFRLQNVSRPGDPMPDAVTLPSVSLAEILQQVRRHPCWTTPLTGPNQGRGIALGLWTNPGGTTSCHLTLNADGSVTLVLGTVDLSATRTSLAMVAAEALGLDLEDVQVVVGDTDMVAYSGASAGDKVTYVTSKAILNASDDLVQQLKIRVAAALEASPQDIVYERKRFWVQGSRERGMPLTEIAQRTIRGGGAVMGYGSASETFSSVALAPNAAAHVVDVEVDRDTGQVKILHYTTFQDVGLCVNPDQVEGQMQGGATQGIGWGLAETYLVDEKGAMRNANLLDYRLPSALDVPYIATIVVEVPSSDHPYGVRAVGQVPIVPPAAALANAIYRATDVRLHELPMTAERLYLAMKQSGRSRA
jgi:CO/xanthine dehydrogenase Mo-binding subunit